MPELQGWVHANDKSPGRNWPQWRLAIPKPPKNAEKTKGAAKNQGWGKRAARGQGAKMWP